VKRILPLFVVLCVGLGVGYVVGRWDLRWSWHNFTPTVVRNQMAPSKSRASSVDFAKFWEVWDKVSERYVDKSKLDGQRMVDGAISGMVAALEDPYTFYLTPEQNKDEKANLGGTFEGVGIQLGFKDKLLVVVAPLDGTPAKRAGVKPGDIIARIVDSTAKVDRDTVGITLPEAVSLIRGKKGTQVELTLVRDGESKPIKVMLERDTVLVKSVELEEVNGAMWLKLSRFGDRTQSEWDEAVSQINGKCLVEVGCKGVVLDLRNNPGGYLDGAVNMTSDFLPKGKVIVIQQMGDGSQEVSRSFGGKLQKVSVVVLINEGSASAAEIMSGALKDQGRAKVVGVKSFGKGSVQLPEDLEDGSGLHTTIAKWLTPSGKWIDKNGIEPDVEVAANEEVEILTPANDVQLQKAIELL
jgi:carboxyl-terminal processing protease